MNIEKIYQSTVEAVKIGVTEQTEADKLYVQVMKLESALNSARQGLEMTYSSMKLQLGVSADTYIELTDNLDQLTNAEASLRFLHTKFDITDNYNYRLMSKNLELSRKQIKLAAMGYSPSIGCVVRARPSRARFPLRAPPFRFFPCRAMPTATPPR